MEIGGNIFSNGNRGQNGNNNNNHHHHHLAWDIWEFGNTTSSNATTMATSATATATSLQDASVSHALMFDPHQYHNSYNYNYQQQPSIYGGGGGGCGGGGVHVRSDPPSHVMCLKLGKRQYFEDTTTAIGSCSGMGDRHVSVSGFYAAAAGKKGRPYYDGGVIGAWGNTSLSSPTAVGVPLSVRCQVEGCDVALVNAKEYHRRHKVCEMHSKAPKVVVLGLEQRFCQQCSRFHAICEFDDSKRSCRRRLAGHNERRRKSSNDSVVKNPSQEDKLTTGRYSYIASPTERALSLLSTKTDHHSWVSPPDLSSRSSAALRELIAENRAAILARQLVVDRDWHWHHQTAEDLSSAQGSHAQYHQHQLYHEQPGMDRYHESGSHITLDLMQAPSSAFGFLSVRGKSKEEVECSELWNSLEGAHVV